MYSSALSLTSALVCGGWSMPCPDCFTPPGKRLITQGWRLRVASGVTAPGPALEGALRFRPMSLSSYILR